MSQATAIEWCDVSWNPVHGCSKVSPGCAHCYAETGSHRFGLTSKPWTPANAAQNVLLKPHKLTEPLRNTAAYRGQGAAAARAGVPGKLVFVNSTSDLFHEAIDPDFTAHVFATMAVASQHAFQVLTKRPETAREIVGDEEFRNRVYQLTDDLIDDRLTAAERERRENDPNAPLSLVEDLRWPLPNVWLGVSIENRRFAHRADVLRQTPAAVRFISAEPLLGPLHPPNASFLIHEERVADPVRQAWRWPDGHYGPWLNLTGIDWLIVGGESGPKARPMEEAWVRDLQVAAELAGTAFFFKQHGGRTPKAGGRELDGRTWDEFPRVYSEVEFA